MKDLIRRWHVYAGLMTFWALMVFGAAGMYVTFRADKRLKPEPTAVKEAFEVPAGATDRQVADLMRARFGFGNTKPVPNWVVNRKPDGRLVIPLWGPNGWVTVTWLEKENAALVARDPFSTGEYINQMHSALPVANGAPLKLLWSVYTELAIFTLLFLTCSGVYLWFTSRPKLWWAQWSLGLGVVTMVAFFIWVR